MKIAEGIRQFVSDNTQYSLYEGYSSRDMFGKKCLGVVVRSGDSFMAFLIALMSNRRLSQVISADYFRRKHLSQSAVNDADAHYIGSNRRLSRAYFSSAEAGLK